MKCGQGFVYVYSITSRSSFEEMFAFFEHIKRVKDCGSSLVSNLSITGIDWVPGILVGNKADAEDQRQVW